MEKLKPILSLILRILFILVIITSTVVSLANAYMIFAPDTFPKPFRLVYAYQESGLPFEVPPGTVIVIYQNVSQTVSGGGESVDGTKTETGGEFKPGEGIIYDTGAKIINLADTGGRRLIRINTQLEFAPNDAKAYEEYLKEKYGSTTKSIIPEGAAPVDYVTAFLDELATKKPIVDDAINSVVSAHTYSDLYTESGKSSLKEEIIKKVNERLPEYKVIAVYFSEFVIE